MSERWVTPTGNAPHVGERVTLVRWVRSLDGWGSETVRGRHQRLDGDEWVIDVLGEERRLPRSEWSHCQE
ncbi:hypothetical protein [Leifsonia poae]|uniref:Uncharacterized protein n=1 Tax=Leifsonia poae TaxID=110933 RepID=A0A9W6HBI2_9MICO|nr:hypothetical protein [Leifsonia poae]GLJ76872.1 hypothetical protein GCM10017584_24460 [Leifsonia poae]